jgi:hypothetical protein
VADTKLPSFENNPQSRFAWPRSQPSVMVQGMLDQALKRSNGKSKETTV